MEANSQRDKVGTIEWCHLTFHPQRSFVKKVISATTLGSIYPLETNMPIFENIFGTINLGELVAVMGPSGAGKTTLIKCLTEGVRHPGCTGDIYSYHIPDTIRASIIHQDNKEHLLPTLTVKETLMYASQLKNPRNTAASAHAQIVTNLLRDLEMSDKADTLVSKCSGGQCKRLAVGLELTAIEKPHILFLDEPTSGLDSNVAHSVIKLLRRIATNEKMAVLTTIHQPNEPLFNLFSKVIALSGDGNIVFNKDPILLRQFMIGHGCRQRRTLNGICLENPADSIIEIASALTREYVGTSGKNDGVSSVPFLAHTGSSNESVNKVICQNMIQTTRRSFTGINAAVKRAMWNDGLCATQAGFTFHKFRVLLNRCFRTDVLHQFKFIFIRCILHLNFVLALIFLYDQDIGKEHGCIYIDFWRDPKNCNCSKTPIEIRNEPETVGNIKFQFFSLLFLMFAAMLPTVLTFPAEITLFLNEHRNRWYSITTYYLVKTVIELPLQLILPVMYSTFLYWYSSQPDFNDFNWVISYNSTENRRFRVHLLATTLCGLIVQGIGFLIGILTIGSFNITIIVASSTLIYKFLFSGFFVKRILMHKWIEWMTHFSFVRFGFESILLALYGWDRCPNPSKSVVLEGYGLSDDDLKYNLLWLIAHLLVVRILALAALYVKASMSIHTPEFGSSFVHNKLTHLTDKYRCVWAFVKACKIVMVSLFWLVFGALLSCIVAQLFVSIEYLK